MGKATGKEVKKKVSKKRKEDSSLVVHFADYINSYDVADILIKKIEKMCLESKEMSHIFSEGGFDVENFANFLDAYIDSDALNEFMANTLGQGVMIGIYISKLEEQYLNEQSESEE